MKHSNHSICIPPDFINSSETKKLITQALPLSSKRAYQEKLQQWGFSKRHGATESSSNSQKPPRNPRENPTRVSRSRGGSRRIHHTVNVNGQHNLSAATPTEDTGPRIANFDDSSAVIVEVDSQVTLNPNTISQQPEHDVNAPGYLFFLDINELVPEHGTDRTQLLERENTGTFEIPHPRYVCNKYRYRKVKHHARQL